MLRDQLQGHDQRHQFHDVHDDLFAHLNRWSLPEGRPAAAAAASFLLLGAPARSSLLILRYCPTMS